MSLNPRLSEVITQPTAAEICGVARGTIVTHIRRGNLPTVETSDGLKLLRRVDVEEFAARERPVGRPPKE